MEKSGVSPCFCAIEGDRRWEKGRHGLSNIPGPRPKTGKRKAEVVCIEREQTEGHLKRRKEGHSQAHDPKTRCATRKKRKRNLGSMRQGKRDEFLKTRGKSFWNGRRRVF